MIFDSPKVGATNSLYHMYYVKWQSNNENYIMRSNETDGICIIIIKLGSQVFCYNC